MQEVGDVYGVTRERIRQLLRKEGIPCDVGGRTVRSFLRGSKRHAALVEKRLSRRLRLEREYGCDYETILQLSGGKSPYTARHINNGTAGSAFVTQKHNAENRGIAWELTLTEWWRIWQESGRWAERGRGKGRYVMARLGDSGPYSVDNVYITEAVQNSKDFYSVAENKTAWRQKMAAANGWAA